MTDETQKFIYHVHLKDIPGCYWLAYSDGIPYVVTDVAMAYEFTIKDAVEAVRFLSKFIRTTVSAYAMPFDSECVPDNIRQVMKLGE